MNEEKHLGEEHSEAKIENYIWIEKKQGYHGVFRWVLFHKEVAGLDLWCRE